MRYVGLTFLAALVRATDYFASAYESGAERES